MTEPAHQFVVQKGADYMSCPDFSRIQLGPARERRRLRRLLICAASTLATLALVWMLAWCAGDLTGGVK